MAGDWIKMRRELASDPDVVQIASTTRLDEFGVVGRLHAVWSWLDQHSDDGSNVRIVSAFLDRLTACPGFAESMRAVGWLSGRDGSLTFPGYSAHNGDTAKSRALSQKRMAKMRSVTRGVTRVTPPPQPEKRREEKKEEEASRSRRRFLKPTREELNLHAAKLMLPGPEVDQFVNFYESKGWMIGKSPMKSWQAAMNGWKLRWEQERHANKPNSKPGVDRNAGTANESQIGQYDSVGKLF